MCGQLFWIAQGRELKSIKCRCGCGGVPREGQFLRGHRMRLPEERERVSRQFAGHTPWWKQRGIPFPFENPMKGKKHSAETRKRYSEARKGKPKPPGFQVGEKNSNWGKGLFGKANPRFGRSWSKRQRIKISNSLKRYWKQLQADPIAMREYRMAHTHGKPEKADWREIKKKIKVRDGHQCVLCGFPGPRLAVHHKNGDHKDNRLDNGITLCNPCHAVLHAAAKLWNMNRTLPNATDLITKLARTHGKDVVRSRRKARLE